MVTDLVRSQQKGLFQQRGILALLPTSIREKGALKRGDYRELKLTGHILEMVHSIMEKIARQQVDKNKMQFGSMLGCGNHFILRHLQDKYLVKKKDLYLAFVDLENAFDSKLLIAFERIPWDGL